MKLQKLIGVWLLYTIVITAIVWTVALSLLYLGVPTPISIIHELYNTPHKVVNRDYIYNTYPDYMNMDNKPKDKVAFFFGCHDIKSALIADAFLDKFNPFYSNSVIGKPDAEKDKGKYEKEHYMSIMMHNKIRDMVTSGQCLLLELPKNHTDATLIKKIFTTQVGIIWQADVDGIEFYIPIQKVIPDEST